MSELIIGPRPSNREIPCRLCGGTIEVSNDDNVAMIANVHVQNGWQVICRECAVSCEAEGLPFIVMNFGSMKQVEEDSRLRDVLRGLVGKRVH